MISRFFSKAVSRRFLCLLLVLLTCFCALSPALVQPAEAVAVADDVLIASLGLLAASWAGITFTTNAGANTAISNLLESKPVVKSSLAALITKNLVVDGAKLLLTSDVRDAFKTVLPEIKDFFQVESDAVSSTGAGVLVDSAVVGASYTCFSTTEKFYRLSDSDLVALAVFPTSSISTFVLSYNGTSYTFRNYGSSFSVYSGDKYICSYQCDSNGRFGVFGAFDNGLTSRPQFYWIDLRSGKPQYFEMGKIFPGTSLTAGAAPVITILEAIDTIPFHQSPEVDGTSALEILEPAPLYIVDPSGGDDKDPTEGTKPEINFKYAMIALEGLIGALTLSGSDAEKDPGIKPDEMIEQLKKAMESYNTDPNPDPDPDPEPDPNPDPTDPDTPSTGSPSFDSMKVPTLKSFFPFCIPFDMYAMMKALCADPVAPRFTFATTFLGKVYTVDIELSAWDNVAVMVRYLMVAIYVVGLAGATRKFIKW